MALQWKKMACVGFLAAAALMSGCGSEEKVGVIDYQQLQMKSEKIKAIEQEIKDKNVEITERLNKDNAELPAEEVQKKAASYRQERAIFMQSKQRQIQSLVESNAAIVAKEKDLGIVMHKMTVPHGAVDITDEVLAKIEGKKQ